MRNLRHLMTAAVMGAGMVLPQTGWAGPLATSLAATGSTTPVIADSLIQKVHGWHCSKKKGWYKGEKVWHRHRRACYQTQYDDDDGYDDDYDYYRRSQSPYPGASIRLHFGSGGDWH
jgi:hypothetical protein